MKVFDISRPVAKGEPIYPGNEPVLLRRVKIFSRDGSTLSSVDLGLHTASHLDAPLHYLRSGRSVDKVPLTKCFGWCRVVSMEKVEQEIGEKEVKKIKPRPGEIVLFKTKNSHPARSKRFNRNFIYLNENGARILVRAKVKAIGIDGPSIRKFRLRPDTVHPLLLRSGVLIYEGLNLNGVRPGHYYFFGVPLKIRRAEASPVRAILIG